MAFITADNDLLSHTLSLCGTIGPAGLNFRAIPSRKQIPFGYAQGRLSCLASLARRNDKAGLSAIDRAPQGFDLFARCLPQVVGKIGSALSNITHPIFRVADAILRFVSPLVQSFFGVFVTALQVAAKLSAALGSKHKAGQSSRSQSNQQKSDGSSYVVALGRFITAKTHNGPLSGQPLVGWHKNSLAVLYQSFYSSAAPVLPQAARLCKI
jgi:hypothetical protein